MHSRNHLISSLYVVLVSRLCLNASRLLIYAQKHAHTAAAHYVPETVINSIEWKNTLFRGIHSYCVYFGVGLGTYFVRNE